MNKMSILSITAALLVPLADAKPREKPPAAPAPAAAPVAAGEKPAWMNALMNNQGRLDDALFAAVVADCRKRVLADLAARNVILDPQFLKALESDKEIHDGAFAAIHPVDSRVVENLQRVWKELGPDLFRRFRHLALGASILRREFGVGEVYAPVQNFKHAMLYGGKLQTPEENEGNPVDPAQKPKKGVVEIKLTPAMIAAVDTVKANHHNAPLNELWINPATREAITKALEPQQVPAAAVVDVLKEYLVARKLRPERRSNAPAVSEYIKALAKRLDTPAAQMNFAAVKPAGKQKQPLVWPMFPVDKAPWPVLMGLGLTWPLDESQYIFEKLQGKHGDERLHTYGPYRSGGDEMAADSLREIPWSQGAWPSQAYVGGVCGTMSTLAAGTWTSLGVPMYKTGQPGHGNLLTYRVNRAGSYYAQVEQSASAGPDGTYTEWPFHDNSHPRTRYAECHYGMALAMNQSLSSWFKTRLAIHCYRALPPEQQKTIGKTVLQQAIAINPFNAELWYYLADNAKDWPAKKILLTRLHELIRGDMPLAEQQLRDATATLGEEGAGDEPVEKLIVQYRSLVRDVLLNAYLGNPADLAPDERQQLIGLMKGWSAQSSRALAEIRLRYETSLQNPVAYQNDVKTRLQAAWGKPYGKDRRSDRTEKELPVLLHQASYLLADRDARETFLRELAVAAPAGTAAYLKKDKKVLRPSLEALAEVLANSYKQPPRRQQEAKKLDELIKSWRQ